MKCGVHRQPSPGLGHTLLDVEKLVCPYISINFFELVLLYLTLGITLKMSSNVV